ncbi:MAG: DUF6325 family protein [Acidimicrobiia bacterium]|nr:DUF6325 family protein [Acidimicrobiia bacterium]
MADPRVHGPIDFVFLEFPGDASGAATARALMELVDRGTVRLYDVMVIRKDEDGRCTEIDLPGASDRGLGDWSRFSGARSGLLGVEDLDLAAGVLDAGKTGAVILFENTWAVPFVGAARSEGGELVASARLTAQQVMDALDAVEMAS